MTVLVTGGCGFIGTNFILEWVKLGGEKIVNLDLLTYAGNSQNLSHLPGDIYQLVHGDIGNKELVLRLLEVDKPRAILHFAAESHVDRSILGPQAFIQTNVLGTFSLLEVVRAYFNELEGLAKDSFRFIQISTDEVFGSLGSEDPPFTEKSPYAPNSPYSASKAGADHFCRAYYKTYGLPVIITNCSNNYGPYQFPEKLIPLIISNALDEKPLPVYGDGLQIRDWIHVSVHCEALRIVLEKGVPGETYNIGGNAEKTNLEVIYTILDILDSLSPRPNGTKRTDLICHVRDRPGHDRRYAIDSSKIQNTFGFTPRFDFLEGLTETVKWYLAHESWVLNIKSGNYLKWLQTQYGQNS
ncbi:MAG: dTDP-glucose 4,6-dehydratase [Deltaproteobacteria bacterium]|jgi:dTDP-glucose 4,6-dehydratase|nr:dTDP-glucose 4,6-dehydratase [Deltaproteobacteria bacterium]